MSAMTLSERLAKRRQQAAQTVARQAPPAPVDLSAALVADSTDAMAIGHAEALTWWLRHDPVMRDRLRSVTPTDATPGAKAWPPARIRAIRARLDWERDDLARAVGVTVQSVAKWERGDSSPQRQFWAALTTLERRSERHG